MHRVASTGENKGGTKFASKIVPARPAYVVPGPDCQNAGGKGSSLANLAAAGFAVPPWYVVEPQAMPACLSPTDKEYFEELCKQQSLDDPSVAGMQRLMESLAMTQELRAEVDAALLHLSHETGNCYYAVRSSAADEDGAKHSYAGQLESFLCVKPEDVPARIIDVWKSAYTQRVLAYRKEHSLSGLPAAPSVLLQQMVHAEVSGVAFSRDPSDGSSRQVVAAVYGLGHGLVSGELDADTYFVAGDLVESIKKEIARKPFAYGLDESGGMSLQPVDELSARKAALNDEQTLAVSELAKACQFHFGTPQDIEWAFVGDDLNLLQSRPITTINASPEAQGTLRIFDNSNIGESYNGVTTPLTFSFARRAYESVYLQFCRILLVPEARLESNRDVFASMIALIRGRIYYNLINWYRVLALLPGYAFNSRFMEQMMGVKEALPSEAQVATKSSSYWERMLDALGLVTSIFGLIFAFAKLKTSISKFYDRLSDALSPVVLDRFTLPELIAYYRLLEVKLLLKWDAPLVNDFYAMIFYGVLGALTRKMTGDQDATLQNDLLAQTGEIISAEPAARIASMARLAAPDNALTEVLCNKPLSIILCHLEKRPEFNALYVAYLAKFGDRCIGELKLESATLTDDPLPLLRSIGYMAKRIASGARISADQGRLLRRRAENKVFAALNNKPFRRMLFAWVLTNARETVKNRENLRFERTRVFGRVRQIFVEVGRRLQREDLIDDYRDVFYLKLDEICGFVDGTASTSCLRDLIELRKREFAGYAAEQEPPTRIFVRGAASPNDAWSPTMHNEIQLITKTETPQLQGIACCPGVVRGKVRVVLDPKDAIIEEGEILVAKRTDPGWITLFPAAAGLLVEHGSLLSHSAIVARELGLPAVVSVYGICDELCTGDIVEFDGATGRINVIEKVNRLSESA